VSARPARPARALGSEARGGEVRDLVRRRGGLELVQAGSDEMGDRLHVSYRLRVKRPDDVWTILEQHLVCIHDGQRITNLDLPTGFRPDANGAPATSAG